jgi:hypothetical protein
VKAALAAAVVALLVLSACGGDDSGGGDADDDGAATSTAAEAELSSYETVADLNEVLTGAGIECNLDYEGLVDEDKEISQCTIEGAQAYLTIWFDEATVAEITDPQPPGVAFGQNWTVELTNGDEATAASVAAAAGCATTTP